MRRGVPILIVGLLVVAAVPVAGAIPFGSGALVPVHVTPGSGGPRTTFRVSMRSPDQTGAAGSVRRPDTLFLSGPRRSGCISTGSLSMPPAAVNELVSVALNPARLGGRWCAGAFHGDISESMRFICQPPRLCPLIVIAPRVIGRFSFSVRRHG